MITMHGLKHRVCWIREQFPWMGKHSGYDLLCEYISKEYDHPNVSVYRPLKNIPKPIRLLLFPLFVKLKQSETYNYEGLVTELKSALQLTLEKCDITHILYLERTFALLPKLPSVIKGKLVGTVHQPKMLWKSGRHNPEIVKKLDALIVLSTKEKAFFEKYLPGRVHYIPHGIDTCFFRPKQALGATIENEKAKRCLYSGVWLRDIETLCTIIDQVIATDSDVQFDLLVPENRRNNVYFKRVSSYSQVHWHSNLNDKQLCRLYQDASLLLMPMKACTANNALLEGAACGLPVITNDVGGIQDYTDSSYSILFPQGDADGMADAVLTLIKDDKKRSRMGKSARNYIQKKFDWNLVAEKTVRLYMDILS